MSHISYRARKAYEKERLKAEYCSTHSNDDTDSWSPCPYCGWYEEYKNITAVPNGAEEEVKCPECQKKYKVKICSFRKFYIYKRKESK